MGGFFDKANTYSVPYAFTTTVLGYNETQLQKAGVLDKANSWALIFDPAVVSKIKGKVTVLDSQRELMAAALMYLGYRPTKPTRQMEAGPAGDSEGCRTGQRSTTRAISKS